MKDPCGFSLTQSIKQQPATWKDKGHISIKSGVHIKYRGSEKRENKRKKRCIKTSFGVRYKLLNIFRTSTFHMFCCFSFFIINKIFNGPDRVIIIGMWIYIKYNIKWKIKYKPVQYNMINFCHIHNTVSSKTAILLFWRQSRYEQLLTINIPKFLLLFTFYMHFVCLK